MANLRSIDGGKAARAKRMAQARVLECRKCGGRRVRDDYAGRLVGPDGRVVFKGTPITVCGQCGAIVE